MKHAEKPYEPAADGKAIVLSSGGIDSTTTMAIAKKTGRELYSLSFNYGQRNHAEVLCSMKVAEYFGVKEHKILDIDLTKIGGSALTDDIEVPKHKGVENLKDNEIPVTYVPSRNIIFLSYAVAWAEIIKAKVIYIGAMGSDYAGYPDCRPEFFSAFQKVINKGTGIGVEDSIPPVLIAPLVYLKKDAVIKKGIELGVDYSITLSCYEPNNEGHACRLCESCVNRKNGFEKAGVKDPTIYYQ